MRHALPWLIPAALLLALLAAAVLSPVEVRLRARALNDNLVRPRIDVRLLWGLVHFRPPVRLPRHPLRDLVARLGLPLGDAQRHSPPQPSRSRPQVRGGAGTATGRRATDGLQHAASGTPARRYLFVAARAVSVRRLQLGIAFQAGDPARTAVAAGTAWAVLAGAVAALATYIRFERPPSLEVRPLFSGPARLRVRFDCILTARLGHVMVAALRSVLGGISERGDAA